METSMILPACNVTINPHSFVQLYQSTKFLGAYNVFHRGYHTPDETTKNILREVQAELSHKEEETSIYAQLKERDLKILTLICEGLSSEEIAPKVQVSKHTVDLCRAKLITHFGAKNVVHLVAEAIRLGIYIPPN